MPRVTLNGKGEVTFKCPGCLHWHELPVGPGQVWNWNENYNAPTLNPSIVYKVDYDMELKKFSPVVCHSWVTDGKIMFLGDCTHSKKDVTMVLSEIE